MLVYKPFEFPIVRLAGAFRQGGSPPITRQRNNGKQRQTKVLPRGLWGVQRPTPRAADAALPRANVGGISAQNCSPARVWDGNAAPLTLSLGMIRSVA